MSPRRRVHFAKRRLASLKQFLKEENGILKQQKKSKLIFENSAFSQEKKKRLAVEIIVTKAMIIDIISPKEKLTAIDLN